MSFLLFWFMWGYLSWGALTIYRAVQKYVQENPRDGFSSVLKGIALAMIAGPLSIPLYVFLNHISSKFDDKDEDIKG